MVEHQYLLLSAKCLEVNKIVVDCTEEPNNSSGFILPNEFQITEECIAIIQRLILDKFPNNLDAGRTSPVSTKYKVSTNEMINISNDDDDDKSIEANHWVKVGHKEILIEKEHLNNHHMTAAQKLMQHNNFQTSHLYKVLYFNKEKLSPHSQRMVYKYYTLMVIRG